MTKNKRDCLFDVLDKTPISKLLTFSAEKLFEIQEQTNLEYEKSSYRKKWIEGIIELKYKSTIENTYKKAMDYFNNEPFIDMDKYNDNLVQYIKDGDFIIKVEFYREPTDPIYNKTKIKKRFSIIKNRLKVKFNKNISNNEGK